MPRYHVRRSDREVTDAEELRRILRDGRYATIALARGDEPYVVTMSYGYDQEAAALYFHAARKGCKLEFIAENPAACGTVVADGGYVQGSCAHNYESVVFRGVIGVVDDPEERVRGMRVLVDHLEDEPESVKTRNAIDDAETYDRSLVLRLRIDEITGKRGS